MRDCSINISDIRLVEDFIIDQKQVLDLYQALNWSSARKPEALIKALQNSHSLIGAFYGTKLIGLGNAISDGHLVVYYPHLLVHPEFQGMGIGRMIVEKFKIKYSQFHQQMLVADGKAIEFYEKCGFRKAGKTLPMWIYDGDEH